MGKEQIKSKERVTEHGEVFTNEREVNAMLDLVKDERKTLERTTRIVFRFKENDFSWKSGTECSRCRFLNVSYAL